MMRWNDLQYREKVALVGGTLSVLLTIIYLLLQPLLHHRATMQAEVSARRAELAWMRNAVREVGNAAVPAAATASPLKQIDQAARQNHLSDQLKRLEPGVNNEIKVWLENAVYVDMLRWLRQLTGAGQISLANMTVENSDTPGLVNAKITFTTGGKP